MKQLNSMSVEELLATKAKVEAAIEARVDQERKRLTASLEKLNSIASIPNGKSRKLRRQPKRRTLAARYRNPNNPKETWAGRGLRPRWLVAALKGGKKKLADFAVERRT
jgi:DNA-binding protein H-NS